MAKYIPLDALVAEIERLSDIISQGMFTDESRLGIEYFKERVFSFLDTLEVKEVDLEKEIGKYLDTNDIEFSHQIKLFDFAKHFYELGLKASNPITASDRGTAEEIIINLKRVEQDYRVDLTREIEWVRNKAQKGE